MRFFLLDHFSRHPWGCVEALKPFLGPFFPRKLLINMLVTLIGENSASESTFNVLGLSSFEKRYSLAKDCFDYHIDILAIYKKLSVLSLRTTLFSI